MLKDMYRVASEHNLDLLITGFTIDTYYDDEGKYYRELRNAPDRIFESQEEFRSNACQLFDAQLLYAPWNKLYRRSYIKEKGIRFPGTFWDDLPFNLDVMREVEPRGGASTVTTTTSCALAPKAKTPSTVPTCTTNVKKNIAG